MTDISAEHIKFDAAQDAKALVIFAHGAGADMDHSYIETLVGLMNAAQLSVLRFNFPYMIKRKLDGKRRPPDRMPTLVTSYQALLGAINGYDQSELPIFIAGKSMGGRVAATLAADKALMLAHNIRGVICLGYPFHPAKKPENLRLSPLQASQLPVLILQGERDALGNQVEITGYEISNQCQLHYFTDGDHDLKPRVKSGYTLAQHQGVAVDKMRSFIDEVSYLS
ncbi:MAG: alpha/beta family hydrolase [Cognaticolwellia sp.]